ncbi:MAG TPA: ATP-dependent DNA ligase, partial [Galbitalea sp.]|nr:ATP-dependent DNA ligase [Galbitalea sp.]
MLAKLTDTIPLPDRVAGGLSYEPKWDGFRGIVYFDGAEVEIGSRGSKLLTRYFPELVEMFRAQLTSPCILDGEIVVRSGKAGAERLDWELLSQRIHPAATRVTKLAQET